MTHRIHPAVNDVQPPLLDPVRDRPPAKPQPEQLDARDDPVLPSRDRRDRRVDRIVSTFGPYLGSSAKASTMGASVADFVLRVGR